MIQGAGADLAAHGQHRSPAAPWTAAAALSMAIAHGCGVAQAASPQAYLEPFLAHCGWTWAWEGEDLVLDLPGWVQPEPVREWVQPGLSTQVDI